MKIYYPLTTHSQNDGYEKVPFQQQRQILVPVVSQQPQQQDLSRPVEPLLVIQTNPSINGDRARRRCARHTMAIGCLVLLFIAVTTLMFFLLAPNDDDSQNWIDLDTQLPEQLAAASRSSNQKGVLVTQDDGSIGLMVYEKPTPDGYGQGQPTPPPPPPPQRDFIKDYPRGDITTESDTHGHEDHGKRNGGTGKPGKGDPHGHSDHGHNNGGDKVAKFIPINENNFNQQQMRTLQRFMGKHVEVVGVRLVKVPEPRPETPPPPTKGGHSDHGHSDHGHDNGGNKEPAPTTSGDPHGHEGHGKRNGGTGKPGKGDPHGHEGHGKRNGGTGKPGKGDPHGHKDHGKRNGGIESDHDMFWVQSIRHMTKSKTHGHEGHGKRNGGGKSGHPTHGHKDHGKRNGGKNGKWKKMSSSNQWKGWLNRQDSPSEEPSFSITVVHENLGGPLPVFGDASILSRYTDKCVVVKGMMHNGELVAHKIKSMKNKRC